jgi:hypothetical protein
MVKNDSVFASSIAPFVTNGATEMKNGTPF